MAPTSAFLNLVNSRFKFNLFMLKTLPSAYFSGVRVVHATEQECKVSVPFKWFSQNPFRSTYFACLSMAAEMSTGLLAMTHTYKSNPGVSMLVIAVNSNYFKKATGRTFFTCKDGEAIKNTILTAINTRTPQTFTSESIGYNNDGEIVAEFSVTWSFKTKNFKTV